jgi:serine phosphatase RsbU (regulator of sigma subunit)/Tfp pilus assembly protein PilF
VVKRLIVIGLFLWWVVPVSWGQTTLLVDSLKNRLGQTSSEVERCHLYLRLGELIYMHDPDSAIVYWRKAKSLAIKILDENNEKKIVADTLIKRYLATISNNMGYIYYQRGQVDKALRNFNMAVTLFYECNDSARAARTLGNIAAIEYRQGNPKKALSDYQKCLAIKQHFGNQTEIAITLGNIGSIYHNLGDIRKALEYNDKALRIKEKIGNKKSIASTLNNMGSLYMSQEDYKKALEYFNKSLTLRQDINDKLGMSYSLSNIGSVYRTLKDYEQALHYYAQSLALRKEIDYKKGVAQLLNNIGSIYMEEDSLGKALKQFEQSLMIGTTIKDASMQASALINIANIYFKYGDIKKAESYAQKSYLLSKKVGFPDIIKQTTTLLKNLALQRGDYKDAYRYFNEEITMRDSIFNKENYKEIQKQQARYEYEKKMAIDSISHLKELRIRDLEIKSQKAERKFFVTGISLLGIILLILSFSYIQKRRDNLLLNKQNIEIEEKNEQLNAHAEEMRILNENLYQQNEEILMHREEVQRQKELIEAIYLHLDQSIDYAKRLQESILPVPETLRKYIDEVFILFRPKDKVSGDFYWWTHVEGQTIVTVADCTGHGVPGAFMSMLGISFLREIVMKEYITHPGVILQKLRKEIIRTLKQKMEGSGRKDGMDMAVISIDHETNTLQYAGANNPLYIITNHELKTENDIRLFEKAKETNNKKYFYEIKPDKMPVAIYDRMDRFTTHSINLQKGDMLYLVTDGFADQFGDENNRKFKSKRLKELLFKNSYKPLHEQHTLLENTFMAWKGKNEQIDDITIIGLKI